MSSSIISGAISLILILISGYVIASGILTISEAMIDTQKDVSALDEQMLQSDIDIVSHSASSEPLELQIKNSGDTIYSSRDINKMDLYLCIEGKIEKYDPTMTLLIDKINQNMWDPGELLKVTNLSTGATWAKFVTSNGVSVSTYIET